MGNDQEPDKRGTDRVDLHREIRLKFPKFQDFLTEIAGNISPGGMFINTESPHESGEFFEFQCSLEDGFPLVSGRAEVVWVRKPAASGAQPAGMGVRFLELYENSRELIEKIVEERLKAGEQTFDLERERAREEASRDSPGPKKNVAPSPSAGDIESDILAATERLTEVRTEPGPPTPARRREAPPEARPGAGAAPPAAAASRAPAVPKTGASQSGPPAARPQPERKAPDSPAPPVARDSVEQSSKPRAGAQPRVRVPRPSSGEPTGSVSPRVTPDPPGPAVSKPPLPPQPSHPRRETEPVGVSVAAQARRGPRISLRRFLELGVISLLVGGGMVLAFHQYWVRPRIESLESKLDELTGASGSKAPSGIDRVGGLGESGSPDGPQQPIEASAPAPESVTRTAGGAPPAEPAAPESVAETVQAWARAWSGRRVDEYLGYYSAEFVPASGISREAWEARRRDRLLNQGAIRVAVVSMAVQEVSPTETLVTFTQSYRSETFRDRVRKTLRMVREEGGWKIGEELVVRQLPW